MVSIDNDPSFLKIAKENLEPDDRLNLVEADGGEWIASNKHQRFDFIIADTCAQALAPGRTQSLRGLARYAEALGDAELARAVGEKLKSVAAAAAQR